MPPKLELTGQMFGKQVVINRDVCRNGSWYWICRCNCGMSDAKTKHLIYRKGIDDGTQGCN